MSDRSNLHPPKAVLGIVKDLEDAGFEAWCVGGSVRDALLGIDHLDWDIATSATPKQVQKLFRRTIPVGIDFGTVGVVSGNVMHEVTTFRKDVQTDGRHAVVEFGASLDEDLARRDFTINAIAYSPSRNELRDPFKGQADLASKVLRAVGVPADRMREDRLRALRAIRFAARFGFKIEAETWKAIVDSAPHMKRLSAERVKQEIDKTMEQVKLPSVAFKMWRDSGMFAELIPSLAHVSDVQLGAIDHMRLPLLSTRPQRKINRLATLFASIDLSGSEDFEESFLERRGSPSLRHGAFQKKTPQNPQTTGYGVEKVLRDLRFSNADAAWISTLVEKWRLLESELREGLVSGTISDSQIRRWAALAGRTRFASVLRLADAFWWSNRMVEGQEYPSSAQILSLYRRAVRIAYNQPIEVGDLAVDGEDLQALGLKGPSIGKTLHKLLDAVITDPNLNKKDKLIELAKANVVQK